MVLWAKLECYGKIKTCLLATSFEWITPGAFNQKGKDWWSDTYSELITIRGMLGQMETSEKQK